jgi:very-short-patch-repair endonuclease
MDVVAWVVDRGGIVSGRELRAAGASRRTMDRLLAEQRLRRVRNGWYSTLPEHHPRVRAVRIGGRLTGASALYELGAWMLRPPRALEVAVRRGSARLRVDPRAVIHWESAEDAPSHAGVASLQAALLRVALDHELEVSVPCWDWAFASGQIGRFTFEQLILALPLSARCLRAWVDPKSQSLLESVARVRLLRAGWRVRSQVRVGEMGAIDVVIADQIALELDGRAHHESSFEEDRRKDLRITTEGRHSIRVTYSMLFDCWPAVEAAIEAAAEARGVGASKNSVNSPPRPTGSQRSHRQRWRDD